MADAARASELPTPSKDDSWVTFSVEPNRSPRGEYVFVNLRGKKGHAYGRSEAHFQLSRSDAFDFAAQLSHAAEWLRREEEANG